MSKKYKIIILVLLVLILIVGGYYLWKIKYSKLSNQNLLQEILPTTSTNPLENKPDINPVDKTNPFNNIKTNPFE